MFNLLVGCIMEPVVAKWQSQGFGFSFDFGAFLRYLIWAANIFLLAKSVDESKAMVQYLTAAVHAFGSEWKLPSLQFMFCRTLRNQHAQSLDVQAPSDVVLARVEVMGALWTKFSHAGDAARLWGPGRVDYQPRYGVLRGPGSARSKLQAWSRGYSTSACFGRGSRHISQAILTRLVRWERGRVRKIFRWRRKPSDILKLYNQKTYVMTAQYFEQFNMTPLHIIVLRAVCTHA
ncbi:unnamed protein product [Prorocentrum cordatum]|uniref:Uncharacterized protein n=1 Tax=Prorocentrum cordatum TaxID=2364126 RepID=A0ABN9WJY7_9DINO|nr:unnamed protein product [Polarella glacialis]